jgi:hypothetical protein
MNGERVIAGVFVVAQIACSLFLFDLATTIKLSLFLAVMFAMIAIGSAGLDHPAGRGIRFIGWLGIIVPAAVLIVNLLLSAADKQGRIVPDNAPKTTSEPVPSAASSLPPGT